MSIHPDIHRALLAHGGNLQDAIRETWMASIPAEFRKAGTPGSSVNRPPLERGTETTQTRAAARRAELGKVILPLNDTGATVPQIARAAKCAEATVRRVLFENGCQPNFATTAGVKNRDWDSLVPRAMELRNQGMSWKAVGKAMGVCSDRMSKACQAWEAKK